MYDLASESTSLWVDRIPRLQRSIIVPNWVGYTGIFWHLVVFDVEEKEDRLGKDTGRENSLVSTMGLCFRAKPPHGIGHGKQK